MRLRFSLAFVQPRLYSLDMNKTSSKRGALDKWIEDQGWGGATRLSREAGVSPESVRLARAGALRSLAPARKISAVTGVPITALIELESTAEARPPRAAGY